MHGPCIAYREDGRVCRAPATQLDGQRGGLVCAAHAPWPASQQQADMPRSASREADAAGGRPQEAGDGLP
jgi:hypothetical protein